MKNNQQNTKDKEQMWVFAGKGGGERVTAPHS